MTSEELANEITEILTAIGTLPDELIRECAGRILGTGEKQYVNDDGSQYFESMSIDCLLDEQEQEAQDFINYGIMALINVRRARDKLRKFSAHLAGE